MKENNAAVIDYIVSLTHLYGLVHKEKVVEIYNLHYQSEIGVEVINNIINNPPEELLKNFVEINGDYFVHETIMEFGDFDVQLKHRKGKPFYIPQQEELLKYKEDCYFEINNEYQDLLKYVTNLLDGDEAQAEILVEDIQGYCLQNFSPGAIFNLFNEHDVSFKDEKQVNEVMRHVMNLANNTRIWENNGHTPSEIFEKYEKPHLRPLPKSPFLGMKHAKPNLRVIPGGKSHKVGRNDPCSCGSGEKYKKCCLEKDEGK